MTKQKKTSRRRAAPRRRGAKVMQAAKALWRTRERVFARSVQAAGLAGALWVIGTTLVARRSEPGPQTLRYHQVAGPANDLYGEVVPFVRGFYAGDFEYPNGRRLYLPIAESGAWVVHHFQDWGAPQVDRNVRGHALRLGGKKFAHGLGTHANSRLIVHFEGAHRRLSGRCGLDEEASAERQVRFTIRTASALLYDSGALRAADGAKPFSIELPKGDVVLSATTERAIAASEADWVDFRFD